MALFTILKHRQTSFPGSLKILTNTEEILGFTQNQRLTSLEAI